MNQTSVIPGRMLFRSHCIELLGPVGFQGEKGAERPYPFSATFWHLKNAEQHVNRFLAHLNVLLKGF